MDVEVEEFSSLYCEIFLNGIMATSVDAATIEPELERERAVLLDALRPQTKALNAIARDPSPTVRCRVSIGASVVCLPRSGHGTGCRR